MPRTPSTDVPGCDFCSEFSGGCGHAFSVTYPEMKGRLIHWTEQFNVVPSLGQVAEGHLLIVPRSHITALADMPDALLDEVENLITDIRVALRLHYGSCVCFEHGARTDAAGGCGIYHAHLHVVPVPESADPVEKLKASHRWTPVQSLAAPRAIGRPDEPYLYYEDVSSSRYLFHAKYLPSQYLRRVLAEAVGNEQWDWRRSGREEAFLSTYRTLAHAFQRTLTGTTP